MLLIPRTTAAGLLLLAITSTPLQSQDSAAEGSMRAGMLRLEYRCTGSAAWASGCQTGAESGRLTGTLASVDTDSLVLVASETGERLVYPTSAVRKLQVFEERSARPWRGALLGLGTGAAAGAIGLALGAATCEVAVSGSDFFECEAPSAGQVILTASGIGMAVGFLFGLIPQDVWKETTLVDIAPRVAGLQGGRAGIGLTIHLGREW